MTRPWFNQHRELRLKSSVRRTQIAVFNIIDSFEAEPLPVECYEPYRMWKHWLHIEQEIDRFEKALKPRRRTS